MNAKKKKKIDNSSKHQDLGTFQGRVLFETETSGIAWPMKEASDMIEDHTWQCFHELPLLHKI